MSDLSVSYIDLPPIKRENVTDTASALAFIREAGEAGYPAVALSPSVYEAVRAEVASGGPRCPTLGGITVHPNIHMAAGQALAHAGPMVRYV